jgi:transcription-repair coupling factor (superfamily II helicase)
VAKDLLEIQAKRSTLKGLSFPKDTPWQKDFEKEFRFFDNLD